MVFIASCPQSLYGSEGTYKEGMAYLEVIPRTSIVAPYPSETHITALVSKSPGMDLGVIVLCLDALSPFDRHSVHVEVEKEESMYLPYLLSIASHSFVHSHLVRIDLRYSNVVDINCAAFMNSHALRDVILPKGVKRIGDFVFAGCRNLRHIQFGKHVKMMGSMTFCGCTALETITLPPKLSHLAWRLFAHCMNLTTVHYPTSEYTVDEECFIGCVKMRRE